MPSEIRVTDIKSSVGLGTITINPSGQIFSGIVTVSLGSTSLPSNNSQMSFELTSDTNLRIKVRGSDGVLRSGNITLS